MSLESGRSIEAEQLTCVEAIGRTTLYAISTAAITVCVVNNGRQILKLPRGGWVLPTGCALIAAAFVAKWKMNSYVEILRQQKAARLLTK